MTPNLSDTQRAVLVKMRDGLFLSGGRGWFYLSGKEFKGEYLDKEVVAPLYEAKLIKAERVELIGGFYFEFTITPLGLSAIGKDK